MMKRVLLLALAMFVVSCQRTVVREYQAPKESFARQVPPQEQSEQTQNSAGTSVVSLKAPPNWRRQPQGPMRKASFVVEGGEGREVDISVTSFPGESGGLLANINRWREQLGLDAVNPQRLESIIERRTLGGRVFVIVDLFNERAMSKNKERIIGAIVPASGETWFFKMTGDDASTAAQKPAFLKVLESAEFRRK